MTESWQNDGVAVALMQRFQTQRLPRAIELKKKVDKGEMLNDYDLQYLQQVEEDSKQLAGILHRYPDLQPIVDKARGLYAEITRKAAENAEKAS